ncbi:MAG: ABC transporter ATP-binding protein [Firmicutes bacterium]|nr:ABC transporter ATP-binding protein [Bacillota bacterium]
MIQKGIFSPEQMDISLRAVDAFAEETGLEKQLRTKLRFLVEELLLIYRDALDEDSKFSISMKEKRGDLFITINAEGYEFNPMQNPSPILLRIIQDTFEPPVWSYSNGQNTVKVIVPVYNTLLKNIKLSWKYMRGERKIFVRAVTSQLLSVGLKIVAPILIAQVIVMLETGIFTKILLTAAALLFVQIVTNLSLFVANRSYNIVYNKTLTNLENDLVDGALRITNGCIDEKGTGLFIQRLTVDTSSLATGFNTLADLFSQMFNYIGILAAILIVSPPVFLVVLLLLSIQSLMELKRARQMKKDDRIYREANERFTGFVSEMVKGGRDVKLLNSEEKFRDELAGRINEANDKRMFMQDRAWRYRLACLEVGDVGYFTYILLLAFMVAQNIMEPVQAIVLFTYYTQLGVPAVLLLGQMMEFIKTFNLSAERVYALLHSPEFPKEQFGRRHLDSVKGEIRFDKVSFFYKGSNSKSTPRLILKDMDIKIAAGSTTALVGKSGSGKTTVLNLISMLYKASSGTVSIDGVNIREMDRETIRSNIAVVTQNPYIFNLSIRDNLRIVKPDLTEEEMRHVCKMACIDEDIMNMTEGYDTVIGEGGTNLSGGQRQRLAIARCLLKDFCILLLDEATSALDNVTQSRIKEALHNVRKDRTVIMVAHRLSTIIDSDHIIYMEDGKILDEGSHSELMTRCVPYRELYENE